ncbi:hypothetical protein NC653_028316 [Populus alba x Populus x berolinensis]|uniref:Uncharacterized protein n=1 Tax=Populus alba x Populus x berolinensis TaxID=444605 RepID=A0AAD6M898_9ROSI|nr:hypothetical protein NC653_028316 [Populus alba x Populus x berolinensis]
MPEEVVRISFGLHKRQSGGSTCFCKACVSPLVYAQIKIPVIDICFPWMLGNIRLHVLVNLPRPIYMLCSIFLCILPIGRVQNHEPDTFSMRERNLRLRNFTHLPTIRSKCYCRILFFQYNIP